MKRDLGPARTGRRRIGRVITYGFLLLCVVLALLPLVWVMGSSFKTNAEIFADSLCPPHGWTLSGYAAVFRQSPMVHYFCNSLVVASVSTVCNVLALSMAAYVFARYRFRGKTVLYVLLCVTLVIPMTALLHPVYSIISGLGLYDTKRGLILVYTALNLPMSLLILRSAFAAIPQSLEEAACIDGAGFVRTFFQIMLPCARGGVVSAAALSFVNSWNEFTFALLLTSGQEARTLPLSMQYFTAQFSFNYTAMFAAVTVTVLPAVVLFAAFQQRLVSVLFDGAEKA